jgi:hypothetical protein
VRPRTLILGVAMVAGIGVAADALGDMTQTRPDAVDRRSGTEIVLAVHRKPNAGPVNFAAAGLWGACQGTVHRRLQGDGFVAVDGQGVVFRGTVYPALGEHARQRLRGCLEDATLDLVQASVVRMERLPVCVSGTAAPTCVEARRGPG